MIHYSISTRTDPDLGSDEGLDKHTEVTDLFAAKLQEFCDLNRIYDNEHERAGELYERAAFGTALELGVEFVREETSPNEVTFTFNFVPTIKITEVEPTPPGKCADCPVDAPSKECGECGLPAPVEKDDPDRYDVGDIVRHARVHECLYKVLDLDATDPIGGGKHLVAAEPQNDNPNRVHYFRSSDLEPRS